MQFPVVSYCSFQQFSGGLLLQFSLVSLPKIFSVAMETLDDFQNGTIGVGLDHLFIKYPFGEIIMEQHLSAEQRHLPIHCMCN